MDQYNLENELLRCCKSAKLGYDIANRHLKNLYDSLEQAKKRIQKDVDTLHNSDCRIPEVTSSLEKQLSDINDYLVRLARISEQDLNKLKKNLSNFSITLFGRTMAGKSTLMEILRDGDGSTIGQGAQRTTRDVRTYEWNNLNITDVPGIGAFNGQEDEKVAFESAKSADLIIFLITDDAPQSVEAECFAKLVKMGKPIACVVNVKAAVNMDRGVKSIQRDVSRRFDMERLEELKNQFLSYAKKAGQEWAYIPFVFVHLKAAYLSKKVVDNQLSKVLHELSKIDLLKQLIVDQVRERGELYRIKTFVDIIDCPMISIVNKMIDQSINNSTLGCTVHSKREKLSLWLQDFKKDGNISIDMLITSIKSELQNKSASFAEEHFQDKNTNKEWEKLLISMEIEKKSNDLLKNLDERCINKIKEIVREITNEIHFNSIIASDSSLQSDRIIDGKRIWDWTFIIAGGGLSIAAIITGALGLVIAGPLGWITLGIGALGTIGSFFFKSRQKKEKEARDKLENALNKSIEDICSKLSSCLKEQLSKILNNRINIVLTEFDKISNTVYNLSNVQQELASKINGHILKINQELITQAIILIGARGLEWSVLQTARIPGNMCIFIIPQKTVFPISQHKSLELLMNETIFCINQNDDKRKIISKILNIGLNTTLLSYNFYIEETKNIIHIDADFDDKKIINRVQLAQQVVQMIITK